MLRKHDTSIQYDIVPDSHKVRCQDPLVETQHKHQLLNVEMM